MIYETMKNKLTLTENLFWIEVSFVKLLNIFLFFFNWEMSQSIGMGPDPTRAYF